MGALLSTNPSDSPAEDTAPPPTPTPTLTLKSVSSDPQNAATMSPPSAPSILNDKASSSDQRAAEGEEGEGEEEEEEEGECGFCLFMKAGGCRDSFIAWEKCVEEAESDRDNLVERCHEVTGLLKKCMEEHMDYYSPIIQAEKAAEEEVKKEFQRDNPNASVDPKDQSLE